MKQSMFFIILCIFIFFLQTETSFAVDIHYQKCRMPKTCGNLYISFPLFISGQQEPYCGFPGFQVTCNEENGSPILQLVGDDYLIHNISYHDQTLVVSNAALSNSRTAGCIPLFKNLTFPTDQYDLVPNQKELFLLYNCNSSLVYESFSMNKLSCFEPNSSTSTSVLSVPGELIANVSVKCGSNVVVSPVLDYATDGQLGSEEALSRGFMMKWIASNCSRCEDSGGKCGFDSDTYHFRCFCPDRPHLISCVSKGDVGLKLVLGLGLGGAGLVVLVIVFVCCFRRKLFGNSTCFWMNKNESREIVQESLKDYEPRQVKKYRYLDVKKMTNSFKEKLGQGGYGGVYKGKLNDGCHVAVKILNRSKGNGEEFMNEVRAISRTSHVNIVSLLGFCLEGSKRALIYEFMPNGSLEKFIFDANTSPVKDHQLGWEALDRIALGIARGLEYLHSGCNTRILHFDIKPHNILLNEDFSPKISDFGLAKICKGKESIVSMMGARGTAGYIAPEVLCRNFGGVSHKSDVYMLETLSHCLQFSVRLVLEIISLAGFRIRCGS